MKYIFIIFFSFYSLFFNNGFKAADQKNIKLGKAGRKRYLGFRPKVRGVVMNPVDHPHGGGEGRTSGGRNPVTPWGVSTKGKKTRNNKKTDVFIIKRKKK